MALVSKQWRAAAHTLIALTGCLSFTLAPSRTAVAAPMIWANEVGNSTMAIKVDGSLWAWGYGCCPNIEGVVALPTFLGDGFKSVDQNYDTNAAIMADGGLWTWGNNLQGQLGNGTTINSLVPQRIGGDFASVSIGYQRTFAIKTDGSLWGWGNNIRSALGDGGDGIVTTPKQIGSGFASVYVGNHYREFTYAIKLDGSLWAWGENPDVGLGDGKINEALTPILIGTGFTKMAVGTDGHMLAIKTDGSLWAWGKNGRGQVGDGDVSDNNIFVLTPKKIGDGFSSVAAGAYFSLALKPDGSLWAWGRNDHGMFGDGTTVSSSVPKLVGMGFSQIAAGNSHSVGLKTDGSLWTWGDGSYGALGDGYAGVESVDVLVPKQIFADGFASILSVSTATAQLASPQVFIARVVLTNDQNSPLIVTPYLFEKDGIQYVPEPADAANAHYDPPGTDGTVKVSLPAITLAARESKTLEVPLVVARPDLTDTLLATAMTVEFGITTSDNRNIPASLAISVTPSSEPAPASALQKHLRTGPVADLGPAVASASGIGPRTVSTDLPSANGDYWNLWVLTEMAKKPAGDEDRKFYLKLLRFGLKPRDAYAVLYLRAISQLKPDKAGKVGWFKLAKGSAQLWAEVKKGQWGLTPDFNTPARTILEGLDSVNALYFLNLLELSSNYSAPLVSAMSDNFAAFASTYTRTSQGLCDYMQNGELLSLPFPRMVEADLAFYMTSNGRWHPKIHSPLFSRVTVRGKSGQAQTLAQFLDEFVVDYKNRDVPGCDINAAQRQWVRIQVHSPLLPMVTDSSGKKFGIESDGTLIEGINQAFIDPGHPWTMAVPAVNGALSIDYALAYPFDYGVEVQGVFNGTVTSENVTRGTSSTGFSLQQRGTVAKTATGVDITMQAGGVQTDSDRVFNWAQHTLPQYFSPNATTQLLGGYFYRYYSDTGSYLAVLEGTRELLYLGPLSDNALLNLGALADWLAQAQTAGF